MTQQRQRQTVEITPAKGRPFLHWVGKKPLERVTAFPAQLVETFNPTGEPGEGNLLFHGDNKEVLAYLLANGYRGKVNLIYIDPPFDSGADYVRKVELRGQSGAGKLDGEGYTLGEQIQYTDIWANDNYLQFMYERLLLLKELLHPTGVLYLHSDHRKNHHLRLLLDEVFVAENYLNTISWRSQTPRGAKVDASYYPFSTHYIHIYAKDRTAPPTWHPQRKENVISAEEAKRDYYKDEKGYFRTSDPGTYSFDALLRLYREGRIYVTKGGEVIIAEETKTFRTTKGTIGIKYYLKPNGNGGYIVVRAIDNLWEDVPGLGTTPGEDVGYPTKKTEALLERIIRASSNAGDLVLDCFVGSGTTVAVAQKLGRRWIGCDINKGAVQTTSKWLQTIIREQAQAQASLVPDAVKPVSLAFSVYRVNDYDLQIQHNEAINLACEHIGITRTRSDAFFDGMMGGRLAKVIPLTHPLTLLDLQLLQDELKNRPQEDRDIVIVCLGKETAVDPEVERWNKNRPVARIDEQGHPVAWQNRVEVIELRTDKRYGKFFVHQPAQAQVDIRCENDRIVVDIQDFISPTIIERLNMDQTLFKAQITDWRAMVDCVMVDTAYDGQVFNIVLSDVPPKKSDLVAGHYELPAPDGSTTVAVKVVDMLGEEVLVTARM